MRINYSNDSTSIFRGKIKAISLSLEKHEEYLRNFRKIQEKL